jgi:hypothetical protein
MQKQENQWIALTNITPILVSISYIDYCVTLFVLWSFLYVTFVEFDMCGMW